MKWLLPSIILAFCGITIAQAQAPTVVATVTTTSDSVIYNYHITNTTPYDIYGFTVFAPAPTSKVLTAFATAKEAWAAGISRENDVVVHLNWHFLSSTSATTMAPGEVADFSFTTLAGVPTAYNYVYPDRNTNWCWDGNEAYWASTSLPVPSGVPEPSSLLALFSGLAGVGGFALKRRR